MRGRSIIDMRSTRTEELVLVEDELEVLSDEDVEEAWAELELEVDAGAEVEEGVVVDVVWTLQARFFCFLPPSRC